MKIEFIRAKYNKKIVLPKKEIKELPKKIILFTTTQFHDQFSSLKKQLEQAGKKVLSFKPKHATSEGQILGCGIEKWDLGEDAEEAVFLYIGDGLFHPQAMMINNPQEVYRYNPKNKKFEKLDRSHAEKLVNKQRGALIKFHSSEKIGVLVTTKYGQQRLQMSLKLKEQFPNKEFFYFIGDNLDFQGLEDFNFIECWINTMCPRIGLDDTNKLRIPIVDIGELGYEW